MGVFGERLKELRDAAGLTQAALAAQTGTSGGFISAVENGQKRPSIVTVDAMARTLHCDSKELVELLAQDTLAADADRKRARQPVAFVPMSAAMLADVPAEFRALVMALTHDPVFRKAVVDLHQALQSLSEPRKEALLTLLAAFATKSD